MSEPERQRGYRQNLAGARALMPSYYFTFFSMWPNHPQRTWLHPESVKVYEKDGQGEPKQYNPGNLAFQFPPDGKDSWGIPIDGSVVVDNKGKSDTSFTYPGAQLLFENEVTGNGYAVMWDSPGTANYILNN